MRNTRKRFDSALPPRQEARHVQSFPQRPGDDLQLRNRVIRSILRKFVIIALAAASPVWAQTSTTDCTRDTVGNVHCVHNERTRLNSVELQTDQPPIFVATPELMAATQE